MTGIFVDLEAVECNYCSGHREYEIKDLKRIIQWTYSKDCDTFLLLLTSFNHIVNMIVRPFEADVFREVEYFSLFHWFAQLSAQVIDRLIPGASTHVQSEAGLIQSIGDVSNSAISLVS